MANLTQRELVVVSGYYGFDNLGDEAILEQLLSELKKLVKAENIVVLSNNPEKTKSVYGTGAVNRWKLLEWLPLLSRTRLFVSGGGGLFQDVTGPASAIYYGGQILLSRILGAQAMIYAQGLGPLRGGLSRAFTRLSLGQANLISVRDPASFAMLAGWSLSSVLTADPVWALEPSPAPDSVNQQISRLKTGSSALVGVSLRTSHNFTDRHFDHLFEAMTESLPADAVLLLLPLQKNQDTALLEELNKRWSQLGRRAEMLETEELLRPSQWVSVLAELDLLVAMRLHAVIMALKSAVPTVGLAYDPKVLNVLDQFSQPVLNLTNEIPDKSSAVSWANILKTALSDSRRLSGTAADCANSAKNMACQNFDNLARILNMQSDRQATPRKR